MSVKFSDKPLKINRELSQTRGPKTKRPKFQNKGTRWSPQFSRQNLTLTTGIDWIAFGYFIYTLGTIFLSNVPVLELASKISQRMIKMIEDLVEVQAEEIPDIDESTSAKQLQLYHHTLEKMEDPKDSEDVYQDYVCKVDKIYSHHHQGQSTFVHVQWKQGN